MGKVIELPTLQVLKQREDQQDLDRIVKRLTELHAKDDKVYTWTSNTLRLDSFAYGIQLLQHSFYRLVGDPIRGG